MGWAGPERLAEGVDVDAGAVAEVRVVKAARRLAGGMRTTEMLSHDAMGLDLARGKAEWSRKAVEQRGSAHCAMFPHSS